MIDIAPFKGFLSSLSHISQLNFEVRDARKLVFFSGANGAKMPNIKEPQALSAQIMSRAAFQYASLQGKYGMFGVPIKNRGKITGSLIAYGSKADKKLEPKGISSSKTVRAKEMEIFLTHVAGLMENMWNSQEEIEKMAEELNQSFEDLHLYSRLATQFETLKFTSSALKDLIEELLETMRVDLAFAEWPDIQEFNLLVSKAEISDKIPDQKSFAHGLINSIPRSSSSLEENYFIVNNSRITPRYRKLHSDPYRFLTVKVRHKGNFYGWLGLVSFNLKEIFRRSELRLLISMAEQIAMAIANKDLYNDLERFIINMVKSLVYAIEAKDTYTRGHSERVNRYCMFMAERLTMEEGQKNVLYWTSILHDIGKIGIPENILNKPDRLNDEEYSIIKRHPKKGFDILKPLEQLSSALPGILHHHERFDGGGYPHGLKGEEIPLLARIIAVADTFDAMTSDRAYRPAKAPEEAMAIMEEVAGSQLDPDLVEVFKEVFSRDLGLWREQPLQIELMR